MPHEIPETDRIRLIHMLEAAREAMRFSHCRGRVDLDNDSMFRRAVIHCLQEIGEAAVSVSGTTRKRLVEVPWNQVVGMRHRLVHVYFDINLDLVWEVIAKDLRPLIDSLESVLNGGNQG